MEMSAATKKKRSEAPEGEEGSSRECGIGVNRISSLPDAILGEVISLLPTKDGARTQVLASRWRHLWQATPLNLDSDGFPDDDDAYTGAISRVLSAHGGPSAASASRCASSTASPTPSMPGFGPRPSTTSRRSNSSTYPFIRGPPRCHIQQVPHPRRTRRNASLPRAQAAGNRKRFASQRAHFTV
ncbi:unnamed protein product [Urochloa humidicola]